MKRKLLFKLVLIFGLLGSIISISNANYSVNLNGLGDVLKNKVEGLHFGGGGNNFGGMFFVTELKDISSSPVNIQLDANKRLNCKKQIEGYYWNSLRGGIIYPLDQQTLNYWKGVNSNYYSGLSMIGGFYTVCSGDTASIYGQIKYSSSKIADYTIQAGRKYDVVTNNVTGTDFAENFQIYNDSKILGLIVDSNYGIAFVGGRVSSGWDDLVNALNTDTVNHIVTSITNTNINNTVGATIKPMVGSLQAIMGILGNFNIMGQKDNNVKQDIKILQKQNKAVLGGENVANVNTVINKARKNVARLCNGAWGNSDLTIDNTNVSDYRGKTICVKNGNIVVNDDLTKNISKPTNIIVKGNNKKIIFKKTQSLGNAYVNVFLDDGYVLFDNNASLNLVGENGNLNGAVTSGFIFKGNIIANGLIAGADNTGHIKDYKHKLYINGSLASLNTVGENANRLKYLSGDLLQGIYKSNTMNLQKTFSWRCLDTSTGSDGVNCSSTADRYSTNAIIIQKEQYQNPLIK